MSSTNSRPVSLYCVPYAGATSSIYRQWPGLAEAGLRVVAIDQPGRGTRSREPRTGDYRDLVESMAHQVVADLARSGDRVGEPRYATFGHSFGAMLSLAVADAVTRAAGRVPVLSVLSAALPPRLQPPGETAALTDAQLLDKIRGDGAVAPELLAQDAMAAYLVRLMRADHAIRDQFRRDSSLVVGFPLTTIAAREDPYVSPEEMRRWAEHSGAPCRHLEIDGGHFAAFRDPAGTLRIIQRQLAEHLIGR